MIVRANCKVNIGLHITGKRNDGYHTLETLFYPIYGLYDVIDINHSDTFQFECNGIDIQCEQQDNLVIKCYNKFRAHFPQIGPIKIRLTKNIPSGAGLGGGSSDAAHTAIALNELFHLSLSKEQLADIVASLGADCPFFIYNVPCLAKGIGEILTPTIDEYVGRYIVLVKPDIAISTREAYNGIDQLGELPFKEKFNDFELSVFPNHPILKEIKQQLLNHGAHYASLSGTGATVFGIFDKKVIDPNTLFPNCFVYQTELKPRPNDAI